MGCIPSHEIQPPVGTVASTASTAAAVAETSTTNNTNHHDDHNHSTNGATTDVAAAAAAAITTTTAATTIITNTNTTTVQQSTQPQLPLTPTPNCTSNTAVAKVSTVCSDTITHSPVIATTNTNTNTNTTIKADTGQKKTMGNVLSTALARTSLASNINMSSSLSHNNHNSNRSTSRKDTSMSVPATIQTAIGTGHPNNQHNDDTTMKNVIGEETLHHLRNIFATPISFAVQALSAGGSAGSTGSTGSTQPSKLRQVLSRDIHEQRQQRKKQYTMPNYPKTEQEIQFLQNVLQKHYLFETQSSTSVMKLIKAFEIYVITADHPQAQHVIDPNTGLNTYHVDIMKQGEQVISTNDVETTNAYFYVLYYGQCLFQVDDTIVGTANVGDAFGELALLYNGPRAATVTAVLSEKEYTTTTTTTNSTSINTDNKSSISSTVSDIAPTASEILNERTVQQQGNDTIDMDNNNNNNNTAIEYPDYTVVLFRVHQRNFRIILQQDDQDKDGVKMKLLNSIEFLNHVSHTVKENLANAMIPVPFNKGDVLLKKGIMDTPWTVIERGTALATKLDKGYGDFYFHEGQCFGERAIMANVPSIGHVIGETPGVAFQVDNETFRTIIGNSLDSKALIARAQDVSKLQAIPTLSSATQSSERVLNYLSKQLVDQTYRVGEVICRVNEPLIYPPSLYLIRKGKVQMDRIDDNGNIVTAILETDAFFGDDQLLADRQQGTYISSYSITVIEEECLCGVLKLRDCRNVVNTRKMGESNNVIDFDSLPLARDVDGVISSINELTIHRMIGAGTFGQVHLVSRKASDGKTERSYALKIQSKYELCQSGQAKGVVREKNIMKLFHNPYVAQLLAAFQDEKCVYMLMSLLQGGELYSIMHTRTSNILSEEHAKFYSICIAEALFYLHCTHSLVFRDLKPENVMIDDQGYAILIDFGFCKKISGKTYTTCGTPLYLAPEVILNRGHSWNVDYWSLGIIIYEMLVGHTPFYEPGMNKAELFQNIVRGKVYPPSDCSPEALSLLSSLLRRDPAKRLGSLVGCETEVLDHPWFASIDRDQLFLREITPPNIPKIKDPFDSSNFGSWKHVDDKRFINYPDLSNEDKAIFKDF